MDIEMSDDEIKVEILTESEEEECKSETKPKSKKPIRVPKPIVPKKRFPCNLNIIWKMVITKLKKIECPVINCRTKLASYKLFINHYKKCLHKDDTILEICPLCQAEVKSKQNSLTAHIDDLHTHGNQIQFTPKVSENVTKSDDPREGSSSSSTPNGFKKGKKKATKATLLNMRRGRLPNYLLNLPNNQRNQLRKKWKGYFSKPQIPDLIKITNKERNEWRETVALKKTIICPTKDCQSKFTSFLGMEYHAQRCNPKRQWKCLICKTCSYSKEIILTHMESHQEMLKDPTESGLAKIKKVEESSSEEEVSDHDEEQSQVKSLEIEVSSNKCKDIIITHEVKVKSILKDLEKHFTNPSTYKSREVSKIRLDKWNQEIEAQGQATCNIENCKKTFTSLQGLQCHSKNCGFDIFWQCLLCKFMTKGQDKLYKHFFEYHPNIIPGKQHLETSFNDADSKKINGEMSPTKNKTISASSSPPPKKKKLSSRRKDSDDDDSLFSIDSEKSSSPKENLKNNSNSLNTTSSRNRPKREFRPKIKDLDSKFFEKQAKAKRLKKALNDMKEWEGLFMVPTTTELIEISPSDMNKWADAIKKHKRVCCPSEFCQKAFVTMPGMKYHAQRCSVEHVWRCLICTKGYFSAKIDLNKHLTDHKAKNEITEEVIKSIAQLNHVNEVIEPVIEEELMCDSNELPTISGENRVDLCDSSKNNGNSMCFESDTSEDEKKSTKISSSDYSSSEGSAESDFSEVSESEDLKTVEEPSTNKKITRKKNKSENKDAVEPENYEEDLKKWNGLYQSPKTDLSQVDTKLFVIWQQEIDKNGIIRCKTKGCSKTYSTILGIKYHYPRCKVDRSWQCLICQAKLNGFRRMKVHLENHDSKRLDADNRTTDLSILLESKIVGPIMARHCEYIQKHFTRNSFEYYKPWKELWELLETSEYQKLLPPLKESMNYKEVNNSPSFNQDIAWKTLSLFESSQNELDQDHLVLFVGGIVIAASWCPTPLGEEAKQYLALATTGSMNENPVGDEKTSEMSTIIQIWNFGHLTLDGSTQKPELCLSIAHDYGMVWDFSWCPSGSWEDPTRVKNGEMYGKTLPRLGLLAVAFNFGPVRIYSIPHPEFLDFKQNNELPVYKTDPFIVLESYNLYQPHTTVTKLSWNSLYDCKYIAAGHKSGVISIWDLSSASLLNKQVLDDGIIKFTPIKSFKAHKSWVQGLSWSPLKDSWILASCSSDRMLYIWDLNSMDIPVFSYRFGLLFDLVWSHLWYGVFVACTTFCEESVIYKSIYSENKKALTLHETDLISFSFSEWLGASISADNGSEVVISHHMDHPPSKKSNKKYILKRSIFKCYTKPLKQNNNEEPNPTFYHMSANEGIIFMDIYKDYNLKTAKNQEALAEEKNKNLNLHNFLAHSIRLLTWNPNLGSHMWLASATSAGLLRLSRVKTVNFGEDLKDILSQAKEWRNSFAHV